MLKINFSKLKLNYSTSPVSIHKCSMHFPNTCAIRMSEAIVKAESRYATILNNAVTNKCPHGYIRGAQDLAAALAKPNALGVRTTGWVGNSTGKAPANILGRRGIICYMQIPGYGGQGHIDLWDGSGPVGSDYWDARTIWFWELH